MGLNKIPEIRDSQVRNLAQKFKDEDFGQYLRRIRLNNVRAFSNQSVEFDFPVTALVGTNGGGKSTILGSAAIAYKSIRPALFFPKSSLGDDSMADWNIGYDIIDKQRDPHKPINRSARFLRSKWVRDDLEDRHVLYFGIQRTVPAGERKEFKKFATFQYKYKGSRRNLDLQVQKQLSRIIGKDVSHFVVADMSRRSNVKDFYVGGDGAIQYSEFHFGAGESSVIRMVSEIEAAPKNSLVLIEEIENGLHPVAVSMMVEYLIDVASRRSIQSIFTTHSDYALEWLPPEAIWSAIDGAAEQGPISIGSLRAITGKVEKRLAIFVEDIFAREWVELIIRTYLPEHIQEIGVYDVGGDVRARQTHHSHLENPAVSESMKPLCILDGDSCIEEDEQSGILKLPGSIPELEIFDYVIDNIESLSLKLAYAMHLPPDHQGKLHEIVEKISNRNRDPHLLFSQVGEEAWLTSEKLVSSAFRALWMAGNPEKAKRVAKFIKDHLQD